MRTPAAAAARRAAAVGVRGRGGAARRGASNDVWPLTPPVPGDVWRKNGPAPAAQPSWDGAADYVIVGAGSAGCVMAARLAASGASVALLEAGGEATVRGPLSIFCRMPSALAWPMHFDGKKRPGWAVPHSAAPLFPSMNWAFGTEAEPALDGRRVTCPRGRGLGGSSAINGMVFVRGHPLDYENWAESGAAGWRWPDVLPYFMKMENWDGADPDGVRGRSGPLHVTDGPNFLGTPLYDAFKRAGAEAGYGSIPDYNGIRQEGLAPMPMTVFHSGPRKGERCSAAAAYLEPARQSYQQLKVHPGCLAEGVLWARDAAGEVARDGGRAVAEGVQYVQGGQRKRIRATREVILCAGAIGSPHLLQLSGVGAPAHVRGELGAPLVAAAEGVGGNLMDHLEFYFQYEVTRPVSLAPCVTSPLRQALIGARWLLRGDGLGATNHFEAGGFVRSAAGVEYPDVQFHFLPVAVSYDGATPASSPTGHSFQLHIGHNRALSRGHVRATSRDPAAHPRVQFNYMSHDEDWATFRRVIRLSREIVAQPAFDGLRGRELSPGAGCRTDDEIDAVLREHLESAYHPCGTCKMGDLAADPLAVTDPAGRVRGTARLRVCDASLFPGIPNGNLNAPTIMTAEKVADAVVGAAPPPPPPAAELWWRDGEWATRQRAGGPPERWPPVRAAVPSSSSSR